MSGTATIPASAIVAVQPNVLGAGGNGLNLIGLALTTSTRAPIGTVPSFSSSANVATYFGAGSAEAAFAAQYFSGFTNADVLPGALLFAQFPAVAPSAYLRGGNVSAALTLAQLQTITSGTIIVTVDGTQHTSSAINLSSAVSYSTAAGLIQTALSASDATFTAAIAGTTMTVSAIASGTLEVGQVIAGAGVTVGTQITVLGTGIGGTGTYTVSQTQTVSSESMTAGGITCVYDSISGAFVIGSTTTGINSTISFATGTLATELLLTSATGAVLSQGAPVGIPATNMAAIVAQTQNWSQFTTIFEPSTATKVLFATWNSQQNNRYMYVMWDSDVTLTAANPTTSAPYLCQQASLSGYAAIYTTINLSLIGAFALAYPASLDFSELNGRATMAFKASPGLVPDVTNQTIASQLLTNGCSFYGAYATANQSFIWLYNGQIGGQFLWVDSYVNQIWLNNALQLALMELLAVVKSIPYNPAGYALVTAAMQDPAAAGVNFGAIRTGVSLSYAQIAELKNLAGIDISSALTFSGYYIQVLDPGAQVRGERGTPIINFFYTDGQSIQMLNITSTEIV